MTNVRKDELHAARSLVAKYPDDPESLILGRMIARADRVSKPQSRSRGVSMPQAIREAVYARSRGVCEAGSPACEGEAREIHHIDRNRHNNVPSNLLHVCGLGNTSGCHGWIHGNPAAAKERGWLSSRNGVQS